METLPELPPGIRLLTDAEARDMIARHPGQTSTPANCVTCGGERVFLGPQGETRCNCEDQWILHRYLLHCGVGTHYQRLGWADATGIEPGAVDLAQQWLDALPYNIRNGRGLALIGNKGTGKTLLSVLLAKAVAASGFSGFFITFADLITALLGSWGSDDEADRLYARCRNVDLLVIDDIGREHAQRVSVKGEGLRRVSHASSEFAVESMLRHRVANAKATIITTNMSVDEMADRYGGQLRELLIEAGDAFTFDGQSYRTTADRRSVAERVAGVQRPLVIG